MSYSELAKRMTHDGITKMAGDLPVDAIYRQMPRNPSPGANRFDFSAATPDATKNVKALNANSSGIFSEGATGESVQIEKAPDQVRRVDAIQLAGLAPATGDEWEEGLKIYRVDKIKGDAAGASKYFGLVFSRAA